MSDIETTSAAPADSGPDLNAIAERLWGKPLALENADVGRAPSYDMRKTIEADRERVAAERQANADAERAKTPIEQRMWHEDASPVEVTVPETVKELREADAERRLYAPAKTYSGVQIETAMENAEGDPGIKAVVARETREWFADIGASTDDAQQIVDAVSRFSTEPVTPERDAANTNAAIDALNREFGQDAAQALKAAQQMVLRDSRLARILDESRLGNDPAIVVKLALLARSQRARAENFKATQT